MIGVCWIVLVLVVDVVGGVDTTTFVGSNTGVLIGDAPLRIGDVPIGSNVVSIDGVSVVSLNGCISSKLVCVGPLLSPSVVKIGDNNSPEADERVGC